LRRKCARIETFDGTISALAERMLEIMHNNNGVGLAGPQVGVSRRIFVCNPTGQAGDARVYINPELSDLAGVQESEEGCLSVPDVHVIVRRARCCKIAASDVTGKPFEDQAEGLISRIWQHEIDHLEGRLIIDRMDATDRIANKKAIIQLETDFGKQVG
jgi:peptide deformylase